MTLSITAGRSVDADEVIDGLAPRDPAVEAEFLAAFHKFHRQKTGEREATTRESLNKILARSGKDFDVYGLYRGCCQRGGFHSREHAKRHMSFAEVYREMNNYDVVNTYTDMWKRLLDAYEKYLLAYEGEHPEDINADKCDVCEREDGAMIQCEHCETWTHEQCHRPRALQRQPIQYPEANAENTAGADEHADSDSDQVNDLAAIAKAKKRVKFRLVFICDSCASMHVDDPDDPDASYLSASLLPIPPADLAHLALAPEFAKLPKDKMMSADTYCQLLIARRRFVPLKSGRRCREDPTVPVFNQALDRNATNFRKPAIAADSPILITDDVDADATASESHDDTVSEDDDRPLAEIVDDVTAAREAQRKARVPEGWVPQVNSTEVTLGANGRRGAVMIQPPAIDPENESKAETWRRLRRLPPKETPAAAEPATTPKGVGASGERPFKIPKRSPAGGEGVNSRLTVMTDLDRYTRGDPQRMNDAHDAYQRAHRSEDPLGSSYDWEKLRVKQKRLQEAKRAQERAAKRGLDEAGDESGPIDLTSEGDRFDFTGDRFDSPPSSPLHRRDDRPGNPSPGKGIRASAAPLDPRMRRKLGEDAQEDATRDLSGRISRFDQTPADREVNSAPGASLVATASLESPRRSGRKTGKDKDDYYLRRSAPTNAPGKCGRARKGHCAICDYTNHKTADCKRQCKNCGAHNHTTAKCMRPIACPICIAPGHTADLCAAVRDPGGKGKETSGKGDKWCECCRSTSHNLDSCRSKFVPCRHCGKKGHLRRYCPQLETPRGFEPGQPEPARNHNAGLTAHTSDRTRNPFPLPGFNSDDLRRLSDDYHSGLRSPDRKDFRNFYPDGPNSRAQGSHFTEPARNPTSGRFFEYDAAQPGCKLCRVNFDGAKCVRERHNKGLRHQSALKRLADQCKEGGGGVGGSRGAVESFPGTRREPVADRDDRANSLPSLRVRTGVESPSTSPDPVQVFSPKEPGEVGDIDRDRTVSPEPGKVVQVRSFEGEKVRVTSPPKVRSPSPEKVRYASPPKVRSPMDAPNSPTAMRVRGSLPTCPHCDAVHPDWDNCRIKLRREEQYAIEELHGRPRPPCPHCGKGHTLQWNICKQRLANNGGKDKPEPAVLQRLKWSAGGSHRANGSPRANRTDHDSTRISPLGNRAPDNSNRGRGGGSPRAHTPASPAETRQRCDICNCNVPNGAYGMKLHQKCKRHKGMVQLMRL